MPKLRFVRLIGPKAVMFTAILLASLMAGTAWAYINRPNPLMDYAPQETGIYDTYYDNLAETDCRYCHGDSTGARHHFSSYALNVECTACHPPFAPDTPEEGVPRETNCRSAGGDGFTCHQGFANRWHHTNNLASTAQCTACHNPQWLGDYTTEAVTFATYEPSVVTPTPYSCENCHWEEELSTNHPSTDIHYDPWLHTVANFQCGIPGQFSGLNDSWKSDINDDGYLYSKPILTNYNTHHMYSQGDVSGRCEFCHACEGTTPSWDPDDPEIIRWCEKCHDIASLHRIPGHVSQNEFAFGGDWYAGGGNNAKAWEAAETSGDSFGKATIYKQYLVNERCLGCHGDYLYGYEVPYAPCPPVVDSILPNADQVGANIRLDGSCFGAELMPGNKVEIRAYPPTPSDLWMRVPVADWTDTRIIWQLPAFMAPPGNYKVRVTTMVWNDADTDGIVDPGELTETVASYKPVFTVENSPQLKDIFTSEDPAGDNDDGLGEGPYYSNVTVQGNGGLGLSYKKTDTGPVPAPVSGPLTKVYTSIVLTAAELPPGGGGLAGSYVVPVGSPTDFIGGMMRNSVISWSPTEVVFKLKNLWKDVNGNGIFDGTDVLMEPDDIHVGPYAVRARSIWYVDHNTDNKPTQTDPGAMGGTPENEIVTVCVSNPVTLNLTNSPYIYKPKPKFIPNGWRYVKLFGVNFGPDILGSKVTIYKGDGTTVKATYTAAQMGTKILLWSSTKVKIKVPSSVAPVGSKRKISVTVAGVESNKVKVVIVP